MPKKFLLSLAAAFAAFSLAACGANGEEEATEDAQQSQQGQEAMPEPEVDDIPDVVATVDDHQISGEHFAASYESQFQQLALQSQMTGSEVDQDELKSQALEMMINAELLVIEAGEQDFSASDDDVDEYLDTLAEANGLESGDALIEDFEAQGLSEDQVREDLHNEVLIEQVIDTLDVPQASDEELQERYDAHVEQIETMNEQMGEEQAQEVPAFEEAEADLDQQATMEKENEALTELLDDLRADAEIETHI